MLDVALKWLYDQLRKKRVALARAEEKANVSAEELESIAASIEVIEWIIGKVMEK